MPAQRARTVTRVEVANMIVRGCVDCGHARQLDAPCGGCGLADPPVVHDLGVQSATYRNPARRLWWHLIRKPAAIRRARAANQHVSTR